MSDTCLKMESPFAYDDAIEALRQVEYPMIRDSLYLDHAGSTLCSKSLMNGFATEMISELYGNPHSASWSSQLSTTRIDNIRLRLLNFFNASPNDFDLIFVSNTTAAIKLVVEGMRSLPNGFVYAHHQACHTSLIGVREEATSSVCLDDEGIDAWINGSIPFGDYSKTPSAALVSYSAQSHMNGRRYPFLWSRGLREGNAFSAFPIYTLLDAASYAATSPLSLDDHDTAPDFTVLSLYKIFGFPDLGVLIVRRDAQSVFNHRRYFGGGTVDMVVCGKEQWHASKTSFLHERLEDGTLPFHNIIAVDTALTAHFKLFGSMAKVRKHVYHLTTSLLDRLQALRHHNGLLVCALYTDDSSLGSDLGVGPVVSFNIRSSAGAWISLSEFEKLAILKNIHIRTGGLCSPGGIASALSLEPWEMRKNFSSGFRCGTEHDIVSGKPTGVIRASFGAMSTMSDVKRFVDFLEEFFVEAKPAVSSPPPVATDYRHSGLRVKAITVYPIKSCGGFCIPPDVEWDVRPEGLAWDREWCLVHRGSGQALSQKQYPHMALLRPSLDFETGNLRVRYDGKSNTVSGGSDFITIPLSANPSVFEPSENQILSRVCGERVCTQIYASDTINKFFSEALGVPCALSRFPPGGCGLGSRSSKAKVQSYQQRYTSHILPGTFPGAPSPPESDTEPPQEGKILLSNESPILMIHSSSLDALNEEIQSRGGSVVKDTAFRANITIESIRHEASSLAEPAFSEDTWKTVHIGSHAFNLLGACKRCQMVCIDQETGQRKQEPYSTLAKIRRFDGKVYFGSHMMHDAQIEESFMKAQSPRIQVGDIVSVDRHGD